MSGLQGRVAEEPVHSPDRRTAPTGKGVVPPVRVFLSALEVSALEVSALEVSSRNQIFHDSNFPLIAISFLDQWWPPLLWPNASFDPCVSSGVVLSILLKYSVVHLVHKACLHLRRYLALLRWWNSLTWGGSSFGSWFDRRNSHE